jgi:hypothetical protein
MFFLELDKRQLHSINQSPYQASAGISDAVYLYFRRKVKKVMEIIGKKSK